jgi:hypothetical protein
MGTRGGGEVAPPLDGLDYRRKATTASRITAESCGFASLCIFPPGSLRCEKLIHLRGQGDSHLHIIPLLAMGRVSYQPLRDPRWRFGFSESLLADWESRRTLSVMIVLPF